MLQNIKMLFWKIANKRYNKNKYNKIIDNIILFNIVNGIHNLQLKMKK